MTRHGLHRRFVLDPSQPDEDELRRDRERNERREVAGGRSRAEQEPAQDEKGARPDVNDLATDARLDKSTVRQGVHQAKPQQAQRERDDGRQRVARRAREREAVEGHGRVRNAWR
jgi:hypothetical protein